MPRATRSKQIAIAEDDCDIATRVPLPETPAKAPRFVLQEIQNMPETVPVTVEEAELTAQLKNLKAAYKTAIGGKGKKGRGKKRARSTLQPIVVEDSEPAIVSPAIAGARHLLSSDEEDRPSAKKERPTSPPTSAIRATRQQVAKAALDKTALPALGLVKVEKQDTILTFSEENMAESDENAKAKVEAVANIPTSGDEDSFVDHILSRSPAKPVSRIEDSVEALDRLEEVIGALTEVALAQDSMLTSLGERPATKVTAKPIATVRAKAPAPKHNVASATKTNDQAKGEFMTAKSGKSLRHPPELTAGKVLVKKPVKRPSSLLPPKRIVNSAKAPTQSTFELPGEAVARKLKEQRAARLAQREAAGTAGPVKGTSPTTTVQSTKPAAKSAVLPKFELPGEALSRKKKEAQEAQQARLKAQEMEDRRRREFKAKPVRMSLKPDVAPRDTTASLARKSQVGVNNENRAPPQGQTSRSVSATKRSSLTVVPRATTANTSAPRAAITPRPSLPAHARRVSASTKPTTAASTQRAVTAVHAQLQKQRGKEIYQRDQKGAEELEKERREREAAAKKARLEAAERGRQASREWAEKQRAKKAAGPDKGQAPGYGPGGQMGLKA